MIYNHTGHLVLATVSNLKENIYFKKGLQYHIEALFIFYNVILFSTVTFTDLLIGVLLLTANSSIGINGFVSG